MTDLLPAFKELLVAPERLALCARAESIPQFLGLLRRWWGEQMSDGELLAELESCNRRVLEIDAMTLAGRWLPYACHPRTGAVSWCLPRGRATTPFFDQFIGQCGDLAVNRLLRPKTALARFPGMQAAALPAPAGFIFHVSRCGSTLVSGCLSELERAAVLSESPLLTGVMLDSTLSAERRRELLPALLDLQRRALAAPSVIVKWNAWDLFHWPLIRALYPRVPVLLLFRDPAEVLASHRRQCGRHMSGDPSLAALYPVFEGMLEGEDITGFRTRVLRALYEAAAGICEEPGVMAVDYARLDAERIRAISLHFGIAPRGGEYARMQQRMRFHSKEPRIEFRPDGVQKRQELGVIENARIERALGPLYRGLSYRAPAQTAEAAC